MENIMETTRSKLMGLCVVISSIFFSACNSPGDTEHVTLETACAYDEAFCVAITADSRCRPERKDMIVNRYKLKISQNLHVAHDALVSNEKYLKCAKLAKMIEYIDVKARYAESDRNRTQPLTAEEKRQRAAYAASISRRKSSKVENYIYAQKEHALLEKRTSVSRIPALAHYHWTRHSSNEAIEALVALDEQGDLDISYLQYAMSLHYASFNDKKALNALHKSLALYPSDQYKPKDKATSYTPQHVAFDDNNLLHFETLRALSHSTFSQGNYAASYVYAKLLRINNDTTANIDMLLNRLTRHKKSLLDEDAEILDDMITNGRLTSTYLDKMEQRLI
jgi:hypothetical protein